MLSRFYVGKVAHHRGEPFHGFDYRVCYAWIDLDEIDEFCASSSLISRERMNLFSFYREDYLPGEGSLLEKVRIIVSEKTGVPYSGKVFALTTLRQMGVSMNPISLFYCYPEAEGAVGYVVVEVHNTPWGERHVYVLTWHQSASSVVHPKELHVSPFMPMTLDYEFDLPAPDQEIVVGINVFNSGKPKFSASLDLQVLPLTSTMVSKILFAYGWQPLMTAARIYYQAFRLWLKKARFYPHPSRRASTSHHSSKGIL